MLPFTVFDPYCTAKVQIQPPTVSLSVGRSSAIT
jgi:hypothetical protein